MVLMKCHGHRRGPARQRKLCGRAVMLFREKRYESVPLQKLVALLPVLRLKARQKELTDA